MSIINYHIHPIETALRPTIDALQEVVELEDEDILDIENQIGSLFDELNDDIYVVIELPYVDRFYRDTYYAYFSSKHKEYERDCIRLSFFSDNIAAKHFREGDLFEEIQRKFLGFLVLRPTLPNIFGRSVIARLAFRNNNFAICNYNLNISLNGLKLNVAGFSHCSQDSESISCAETTIWALMEYFGNRYPDYRPVGISHIINTLNKQSNERMLPSSGLNVSQISYALKEYGFGTYIYSRSILEYDDLKKILAIYIESGIPTIIAIKNDSIAHACLVIGYQRETAIDFTTQSKQKITFETGEVDFIDYAEVKRRYVVQDDNQLPLRTVFLDNPVEHYDVEGVDSHFQDAKIESIVVPLYNKIYLEAEVAKFLALKILGDRDMGFSFNQNFVFRFFLSSSRSFKAHITDLDQLPVEIRDTIILKGMPKFIWVAEIYEQEQYGLNTASGIIIIDGTEASERSRDAILFLGYPDNCIFKDQDEFVTLEVGISNYIRFNNNLS